RAQALALVACISWFFSWLFFIPTICNVVAGAMALKYIKEVLVAVGAKYPAVHQQFLMKLTNQTMYVKVSFVVSIVWLCCFWILPSFIYWCIFWIIPVPYIMTAYWFME
ncbi:hypothetical protein KIPB_012819, partial [Kipferlia bialata]